MKLAGTNHSIILHSPLPTEGRNGDWRFFALPITVRERVIIAVTAALKDKPDCERKVFDEAIVQRWRSEAKASNNTMFPLLAVDLPARQLVITDNLFQYCIDELRHQAANSQVNGFTEVMDANATVYIADKAASLDTKTALQSGVTRLEHSIPDKQRDWHPGSDGKNVDEEHLIAGSYEQGYSDALVEIYGLEESMVAIQVIGQVLTREDRLLVFPNVLHHCVSSFELADKSRPGHRKLLALFLVDPNTSIPSTANIPPQQRDWWAKQINQIGAPGRLPQELADRVYDNVRDFPISLQQAKEVRDDLMEERKAQHQKTQKSWRSVEYAFCEH